MNSSAPLNELRGDPRSVPYSFTVIDDETRRKFYGSIPHSDLPFEQTPLNALFDIPDIDKVGVMELATYLNYRLLPKLWQADKAVLEIERNIQARNERAVKVNQPIMVRLNDLEKIKDDLLKQQVDRNKAYLKSRESAISRFAESAAKIGLFIDPKELVLTIPPEECLKDIAAHAAKEKLPHCPEENDLFWSPTTEFILLVLIGTAIGLSIGAVAGMVHLNMIAKEPAPALVGSGFGIAVAMYIGRGIKALWRSASEEYYLGNPWKMRAASAFAITFATTVLESVVDLNGLMAQRNLHAAVQATSGHAPISSGPGVTILFLCGAILSVSYSIYMAMSGWRKSRKAAANQISLSMEQDRLEKLGEIKAMDGWSEAVASSNALAALAADKIEEAAVLKDQGGAIATREKELRTQLLEISYRPTETECAVLDRAITELEGAQTQFDGRLTALRQGKVRKPSYKDRSNSTMPGLWSKVTSLFKPRKKATEGL